MITYVYACMFSKVMLGREGRYPIYATGHGTSVEVIKTVGCDAK
jgi:hypothetical protein